MVGPTTGGQVTHPPARDTGSAPQTMTAGDAEWLRLDQPVGSTVDMRHSIFRRILATYAECERLTGENARLAAELVVVRRRTRLVRALIKGRPDTYDVQRAYTEGLRDVLAILIKGEPDAK